MSDSSTKSSSPSRRQEVIFFVAFIVLIAVGFGVISIGWMDKNIITPFTGGIAAASEVVLNVLGQQVTRDDTIVRSSSFAVNIQNGCNGVETMIIYAAAVLAFPVTWRSRLLGCGLGLIAIQAVNLVRVVALFMTGAYFPKFFDASHTVLWQTLVILFGLLLWVFWASRFATHKPKQDTAEPEA